MEQACEYLCLGWLFLGAVAFGKFVLMKMPVKETELTWWHATARREAVWRIGMSVFVVGFLWGIIASYHEWQLGAAVIANMVIVQLCLVSTGDFEKARQAGIDALEQSKNHPFNRGKRRPNKSRQGCWRL